MVHKADNDALITRPEFGSVVISKCDVPHEVWKVKKHNRTSLVFFLSPQVGVNRRPVDNIVMP